MEVKFNGIMAYLKMLNVFIIVLDKLTCHFLILSVVKVLWFDSQNA